MGSEQRGLAWEWGKSATGTDPPLPSLQEKAMGNSPLEMMDREKAYIPELQISFMEHIAMPIYK